MNKNLSLLSLLFGLCYSFLFSTSSLAQADAEPGNSSEGIRPSYMGSVEIGFLHGKNDNSFNSLPDYKASPSVLVFNGYRAHRLFAFGLSTGVDFYENLVITPLGLGIRGTLFNLRISPFYSLDAGYGASFLNGNRSGRRPEGGWFVNPALGMQVNMDNKTAFLFGLGYKQQRVEYEESSWWGSTIHQRITYKRMSVRMGFLF